jgi:hypothetical protein
MVARNLELAQLSTHACYYAMEVPMGAPAPPASVREPRSELAVASLQRGDEQDRSTHRMGVLPLPFWGLVIRECCPCIS